MWNLVAEDTREGQVYLTLLNKLDQQRDALGGQVFDVLGEAFRGQPLRDLLLQAIRYGDQDHVRARLEQVIDERVGDGLAELVDQHALASDVLHQADVARIRAQMEEAEARRLQPHYIRSFFLEAFRLLGGRIVEREPGRYEITHVPADVRARDRQLGTAAPVVSRYERVCFDKALARQAGKPPAELIAPGHPLLDGSVDVLLERHGRLLSQGSLLIDDLDAGDEPRVLVYLEHAITDGRDSPTGGRRVVSRRFEFVELHRDGTTTTAGAAPYLDYRQPTDEERRLLAGVTDEPWLTGDLEAAAIDVAINGAVPAHLIQVRARTFGRVQKVRKAVHERLTREINHWDYRAIELDEQVAAGRQPRMNPDRARQRAEELANRLRRRMAELDKEEQLQALPPVVAGACLVVPAGLLARRRGDTAVLDRARDTSRVENLAVQAVVAAEEALDREPEIMPPNNPGFDIRSRGLDEHLWFIEVKGRIAGGETVTLTRNEILTGLNTDRWVLALVEVQPDDSTTVRYLHHPFRGEIDDLGFTETSRTYPWSRLWAAAQEPT